MRGPTALPTSFDLLQKIREGYTHVQKIGLMLLGLGGMNRGVQSDYHNERPLHASSPVVLFGFDVNPAVEVVQYLDQRRARRFSLKKAKLYILYNVQQQFREA